MSEDIKKRVEGIKTNKKAVHILEEYNRTERKELLLLGWTTAGPLDEVTEGTFDEGLSLKIDQAVKDSEE